MSIADFNGDGKNDVAVANHGDPAAQDDGGVSITLHIEGTWQAPGPVGNFKISGTLGGRQVAVLVPEA